MNLPHQIAASSQQLASLPHHSAWVAASAGSGKTKVLTDRVLNLLLEGCAPERILCLTFTKAAAAEMANRIRERLGEWAILPTQDLQQSLETLCPTVSEEKITRARTLFGLALDTPGGLKIQTIHSFCQALLKQFPLEAGISPFFNIMDEGEQKTLIQEAFYTVMETPSFTELALRFNEASFEELNAFILQKRASFLGTIPPLPSMPDNPFEIPKISLKPFLPLFRKGSPTDQERGETLTWFLDLPPEEIIRQADTYISIFLTQQGEKRARLLTQKLATEHPTLKDFLEKEADRLLEWSNQQKEREVMTVSHALSTYAHAFLKAYDSLKKSQSLLDYEDLILKTIDLLQNPGCHWVLYKLDGGLDHILLDEAQDTSPTQWQVIRAIAEEFYANAATDPRNRTLFIVGDQKQSIYSFQGADPAVFTQMQSDLRSFAKNSEKKWEDIDLNVSFRSAPEVLELVNITFPSFPHHLPFRKEASGHVEVWPLLTKQAEASLEPWQVSLTPFSQDSLQKQLAHRIAKTIQGWLYGGSGPLSRPVTPGDVLILVRRRTTFVETMIRALKEYAIPVAGLDRLWLLTSLGVQDLLKIGEFLLLPEDDLALATVLKGPLFDMSEDDLFSLSYNRGACSLWQKLLGDKRFIAITSLLQNLLAQVDFLTPFALYNYILGPLGGRKKWHAHLGTDVLDSLDEFLNMCLLFQEEKTASLQGFLQWVSQEIIELKRDPEKSDQVRVMTVHGAKGQQAPIVFLPDTTQPPFDLPPFGFHKDSLVWFPSAEKDTALTRALKEDLRQLQSEEYWRLLYVALTRAEDALYICGWEGSARETWYSRVVEAIEKIGTKHEDRWYLSTGQRQEKPLPQERKNPPFLLPQWLQTPPLPELPSKILRPSSEVDDEKSMGPSLFGSFGRKRGVLIHKLLEILPLVEENKRYTTAFRYLERERVEEELIHDMITCVQNVFKTYPDLFGPHSQGEVPLAGHLGNVILSGQIDRLIVNDDSLLIVDFKTQGLIPENLEKISKAYLRQMGIYQTALSQIYPDKAITCGLLWTEEPRFDLLPPALLEKYLWLGDLDSNQGCPVQSREFYR